MRNPDFYQNSQATHAQYINSVGTAHVIEDGVKGNNSNERGKPMKNITNLSIHEITVRAKVVSGAVAMALGLLLFVLWFGWSLNSYVGNVVPHFSDYRTPTVSAVVR
jgi:hypothetical protein